MDDTPDDEIAAEMAAIAAQRRAGIRTVASGVATFVVVAFIGEFTLSSPIHLGVFELTRGHAYLIAPLLAMIVGAMVFLRFRPKGGSFLDNTSLLSSDSTGGPRDAEAEDVAGLTSGRRAIQAKFAAAMTLVFGVIAGHLGVGAYYTYQNELPREPYEYRPRLRLEVEETLLILMVSAIVAFVVHRVLAPASTTDTPESLPVDADTSQLMGDIRRKSRQATTASIVGGLVGLGAGFGSFYALMTILEPRSALGMLAGASVVGVLVGGALRQMLLPASMRDEEELDFAALPPGDPAALAQTISDGFRLSRRPSLLDLVGLGSRAQHTYELIVGGGVVGFVTDISGPLSALALGSARPLTLIVSDGETRAVQLEKGAFGSEIVIRSGAGEVLGRVRRSRLPFIQTLVVELGGESLTLKKRWFSKRHVLCAARGEAAEALSRDATDATGLKTRVLDVSVADPEHALAALAGALAMEAI